MILLHGSGSSVFSWNRVMKSLAHNTVLKVLAFHRPAFGLTSRVSCLQHIDASGDAKSINPYSTAFLVLITLYFIDLLASEKETLLGMLVPGELLQAITNGAGLTWSNSLFMRGNTGVDFESRSDLWLEYISTGWLPDYL
ncbi:hypothetical protein Nepgr_006840 [Nepenthes gracilis]|uniref:Uncharacterized protein n=1 Tax=Nepenthes gracilis TaxID=150966 RepID=A0AAD3S656_NEPGR|nr:hypothetical protein Nepgr_006840 [Nepenthes gracilis]